MDADVIIVGSGLSGLVAAAELLDQDKKIILVDQESPQNLGGQAYWSFGGLFLVHSPEQRRMGIKDSYDLAMQDWMGTAGFDRETDYWPRKWAEAYVAFATTEKRNWLRAKGIRFFPVVGWAERGGYDAVGPGNSVPRFHITWGTGPGLIAPFIDRIKEGIKEGKAIIKFRHQAQDLIVEKNTVLGVHGRVLEPDYGARGIKSSRAPLGEFTFRAQAVIIASGGIGANRELVKKNWPKRLGSPPRHILNGVPDYVDGQMLSVAERAGAHLINTDRMWHYTEGIKNWNPIWSHHGIRILPGPSSLWFDAKGNRLPAPYFPGFDTLGTLGHILNTGYDYSWFILNQKIISKEFALSGSEQNPDLTGKSWKQVAGRAFGKGATGPVEAFKEKGADFIIKNNLEELIREMNASTPKPLLNEAFLKEQIIARDRQMNNSFSKDLQITALRGSRKFLGDRLIRTAKPHKILDPHAGPLIAVKLHILTRKTLGGIETNLSSQVLNENGDPVEGLFAAGEAAGFGGGGMHGYRSLEGTFLGGCIFSGRAAGRAAGKMPV